MPLRDHFHPPFSDRNSWDGFHGLWPALLIIDLSRNLPRRYRASPTVHLGSVISAIEIDIGTFDEEDEDFPKYGGNGGGVATAVWAPPRPTLAVATDLPKTDVYEVQVFDDKRNRLVAAVEIVSPSNKDRPDTRRTFVAKCAALLMNHVSITIVDLVTTRTSNLYAELLALLGLTDPALTDADGVPPIYSVACRLAREGDGWRLEAWSHPLVIGEPLPTLPLWLAGNFAVPLELEATYEEAVRVLRVR